MDIHSWLDGLGLTEYGPIFTLHKIDCEALLLLTSADLKEMGIQPVGHRRKIFHAIEMLRESRDPGKAHGTLSSDAGERRRLTVLFCDLVGSTALSSRLDPEDLRELLISYQQAASQALLSYNGFVARFIGDGILAYFGYPSASEDDAERAIEAALEIVRKMTHLSLPEKLSVRIGIATGSVVVGDLIGIGSAKERTVIGDTPNLASRLQTMAQPNEIVICAETRRLTGELFDGQAAEPQILKGLDKPCQFWRISSKRDVTSRYRALRKITAPLIGREETLAHLKKLWMQALDRQPKGAILLSEPGIGKSRLAEAMREHCLRSDARVIELSCSALYKNSSLRPFLNHMERAAGLESGDNLSEKLQKLAKILNLSPNEDQVALLAEMLGLLGEEMSGMGKNPQQKKELISDLIIGYLAALANQGPILLIVEDLHWIDPTSDQLLRQLNETVKDKPIFLLTTARLDYRGALVSSEETGLDQIMLGKLPEGEAQLLLKLFSGSNRLSENKEKAILAKAEGVPLYIEEMAEAAYQSQEGELPATLQMSLTARLDQVGKLAKDVAEIASVIGRDFSFDLLALLIPLPFELLEEALNILVRRGVLLQKGQTPNVRYSFRHILLQEAAYTTLLRGVRRDLHARIADLLEKHYVDRIKSEPEVIAHHFSLAQLDGQAIGYWRLAGDLALRHYALKEAIGHYSRAIALLPAIGDTQEKVEIELYLQTKLGQSWFGRRGFGSVEAEQAFSRARQLIAAGEAEAQNFPTIAGHWSVQFLRASTKQLELGVHIKALAEKFPNAERNCIAYCTSGATKIVTGQLKEASLDLDCAIQHYFSDEKHLARTAETYGQDIGVSAFSLLLWPLALQECNEEVAKRKADLYELCRRVDHKQTTGYALWSDGIAAILSQNLSSLRDTTDELTELVLNHQSGMWQSASLIFEGWLLQSEGRPREAITLLEEGIGQWKRETGALATSLYLCLLAEAYLKAKNFKKTQEVIAEVFSLESAPFQKWIEPEMYRIKGLICMQYPQLGNPRIAFEKGIALAKKQKATVWERRLHDCQQIYPTSNQYI